MFLVQVIINLGMCLGLTPVIGITLPFFSAGGSSMLSVWVAIGLVLSVLRNRKKR
jgi:rod shape determining protein RodA